MYTDGIKLQLSHDEVNEALGAGASSPLSGRDFLDSYRFGSPDDFDEHGYIHTKFSRLTTLSRQAVRKYQEINQADIDEILQSSTLGVSIATYRGAPGLGKDSHIVLNQGDKIIQPIKTELLSEYQMFDPGLKVHFWETVLLGHFAYADIDPKAKTTIIFILPTGEDTYEVDFSRYK